MRDARNNVSRADYFAAHAPPVPDWFEGPDTPIPPCPKPASAAIEAVAKSVEDGDWAEDAEWPSMVTLNGETYGVTPAIVAAASMYHDDLRAWYLARDQVRRRDKLIRLASWARAYAIAMLWAAATEEIGGGDAA